MISWLGQDTLSNHNDMIHVFNEEFYPRVAAEL